MQVALKCLPEVRITYGIAMEGKTAMQMAPQWVFRLRHTLAPSLQ